MEKYTKARREAYATLRKIAIFRRLSYVHRTEAIINLADQLETTQNNEGRK